jgi:hypothetical protein
MWNDDPFKATDGKADNDSWGTQTAMWQDHRGNRSLVERPRDVKVGTTSGKLPGKAEAAIGKVSGLLGSVTGGEKLPAGGLHTGTVQVAIADVASLPAPLNNLNLKLTEKSVVATEAWDASGPRQAALRARTYTAAGPLTQIMPILRPVTTVLSVIEPSFKDFSPGTICPDIVPADRVVGGSNPPMYQGAQPCY